MCTNVRYDVMFPRLILLANFFFICQSDISYFKTFPFKNKFLAKDGNTAALFLEYYYNI